MSGLSFLIYLFFVVVVVVVFKGVAGRIAPNTVLIFEVELKKAKFSKEREPEQPKPPLPM